MNRPVHFEFNAADAEASVDFFASVFDWTVQRWGDEKYWLLSTGDGIGIDGAIMPSRDGQPRTVNIVEVDSVDAHRERVIAAGGEVIVEKTAMPGLGWLVYCADPGGLIFGMMESDESAA